VLELVPPLGLYYHARRPLPAWWPQCPGGPSLLIDHEALSTISTTMAFEILSYEQLHVSLSLEDLTSVVSSALELTLPLRRDRGMYDRAPNLPD
jgi:hypothetical protein